MYAKNKPEPTILAVNDFKTGETIEAKIRRIENNKEPITDGAPLIYTERKDGVRPEFDIRTDRFEIAVDAMDYVTKAHIAKRGGMQTVGEQAIEGMKKEGGEATSIQATDKK